MFFKSLILGAVCAFMAGGAVYYSSLPTTETSAPFRNQSAVIPQIKDTSPEIVNTNKSQQQVQYQYESENTEPKERGPRRWLDQYLKRKSDPKANTKQNDIDVNRSTIETSNPSSLAGGQSVAEQTPRYTYEDIQSNQNGGSTSNNDIADSTLRTVPNQNRDLVERRPSPYINNTGNVDKNIQIAMNQIAKISAPTISEQAYFSLVSYALSHKRFDAAQLAMNQISTLEMRETARINMAVALAKNGQSSEAFNMVNAIEAPEYRDILRLQVIEALLEHKVINQGG